MLKSCIWPQIDLKRYISWLLLNLKIENLGVKPKCKQLELGANKIRLIENLGGLMNLTDLYLGKNKIETIENLPNYQHLRVLSL